MYSAWLTAKSIGPTPFSRAVARSCVVKRGFWMLPRHSGPPRTTVPVHAMMLTDARVVELASQTPCQARWHAMLGPCEPDRFNAVFWHNACPLRFKLWLSMLAGSSCFKHPGPTASFVPLWPLLRLSSAGPISPSLHSILLPSPWLPQAL